MRTIDLKKLFIADYRYDWENEEFLALCIQFIKATRDHKFYETSPSLGMTRDESLSEFAKDTNL
jgi:hypothetical protein